MIYQFRNVSGWITEDSLERQFREEEEEEEEEEGVRSQLGL